MGTRVIFKRFRDQLNNMQLKWSMIIVLLLCWLLPFIVAAIVVLTVISESLQNTAERTAISSAEKAIANVDMQLENCRNASRNATYFTNINEYYDHYLEDGDAQELYDNVSVYLAQQYRYNTNLNSAIIFFKNDPETLYATYSSGVTYDSVRRFKEIGMPIATNLINVLDTDIWYYKEDNLLYMMRNLINSDYKPYGMIVLEINLESTFDSLESAWGYKNAAVFLNGTNFYGVEMDLPRGISYQDKTEEPILVKKDGEYFLYYTEKMDRQNMTYLINLDKNIVESNVRSGYYVCIVVFLSVIPLIFAMFFFFTRKISRPVEALVEAAEEISTGNYGIKVHCAEGSREFRYLGAAFDEMSAKLRHQFDQIYLEEVALRDANIKALQSQINPHFLNNTLEIINWEARMNGADKVSSMIEALSTMLNATLNRKRVTTISLAEELEYMDAYLYIIKVRMGDRITIEKHINENLLRTQVPALIIQPVVENAVEHGCALRGSGVVAITIYERHPYVYIEVKNSGNMDENDIRKVDELLNKEDDEIAKPGSSLRIGIRNVNKRLKLMYGEECGLTIANRDVNTVSTLIIKIIENTEDED